MNTARSVIKIAVTILAVVSLVAVMFGLTIAQEVPSGTVKGRVVDEQGAPVSKARVSIRTDGEYASALRATADDQGYFTITDVPAGAYTGYATARGYESTNLTDYLPFKVKEGKTTSLKDAIMYPRPPSVYGSISSVFMPEEDMSISLNGYSAKERTTVTVDVYRYDFAAQARKGRLDEDGDIDNLASYAKQIGQPVYQRTLDIRTDSEGYFTRKVPLRVYDCGGYLIRVRLESAESLYKTLRTDLALVTKRAPGKTLVYATSYTKRCPLAGVDLELYGDDHKRAATGTTDSDGLCLLGGLKDQSITVLGSFKDSYALASAYNYDQDERSKCYIYTDRPVYRPGHTVMFKGILRSSQPGKLAPVAGQGISAKIKDSEGTVIKTLALTTNRFGSFNGKLELDPEAKPGHYSIEVEYQGESHGGSFSVEEYRKPEFKSAVSFTKPRFVGGQTIEAGVEATYYFGGPVAGAKVTYTIYKADDYFGYYPDDPYASSFYQDLYYSDSEGGDFGYGGYGEVVLEGEGVTDASGVLKLRIPTKTIKSDQRYSVEASVMDASGRSIEVSGSVSLTAGLFVVGVDTDNYIYAPNANITATVYSVDYDRKPVSNASTTVSVYRYDDEKSQRKERIFERTVQTDPNGRAQVTFAAADRGSYEVVVTAQDQMGNHIESSRSVYVADDDWTGEGDYRPSGLKVSVDKKTYQLGDTARVMITSPVKECYVLLTIEGRRLFKQQVIHMAGATKIVKVPLLDEYAPNVYASACLVNGKKMAAEEVPIPIAPQGKFINVRIASDKPRYLPGETATYTIATINQQGKGVPAEVSLGVVDESIYAIREDTTPDIKKFFHGPVRNLVSTSFSFNDYYYGGEDKFQGKVRKYFPDTAYWNPSILTDEHGAATVSFKMPDNLTTWRATARAVTDGTACGSARHTVTVRKNILVRLQVPRFFRQRDQLTITSVIHNYTDRDQNMKVWLEASGLPVQGPLGRTVNIASNGSAVVTWIANPDAVGTAKLTVYAQGQGDQDAMQLEAKVIPHGIPEMVSTAGVTNTPTQFTLTTPAGIIANASELKMGFSCSLAGAALGITDAIEDYQMESPEGIMDVLLPNVVMYHAMELMGDKSPVRLAKIRKLVKHDLKLVYQWQLPGGGWGWSEYGEKDPWMTAYVVYGLIRAKQAGLAINEGALQRGISATIESIPDVKDLGKRATMIYVLALAGKGNIAWVDPILKDKQLQNYSLSLMILALNEMGESGRARALVPKLINGSKRGNSTCSWPETFPWGFYSCNEYETTAYAIRALLAVDPRNPNIDKGIRWLVARRKANRYDANYDTASVVYALADYLQARDTEAPNYSAKVYLNGNLIREFKMDAKSVSKPELTVSLPATAVQTGPNTVRIEKTGPGELYYWANIKYYSTDEDVRAKDYGRGDVTIERNYYRLQLVKDRTEGLVYRPYPLGDTATVGELVRCRLVIRSSKDFQYLAVEDMLPSGCEVIERYHSPSYDSDYGDGWDYWWGGETVYDNRIKFYAGYVYTGKRVIEYDFRPEIRGTFHVMPATAQGVYEPDVYAHSSERRLVVR